MDREFYVYILTNAHHTVLYTGVTGNLVNRVSQHRQKLIPGFTQRYSVTKLVCFETYVRADQAIEREKQIKAGSRQKKLALINSANPEWRDLFDEICGSG